VNRATAQVTIGSTVNPQAFSILELESDGTKGLRLPQMTTAQRNALNLAGNAAAQGLQIFNTTTRCVETWNGTKWIEGCVEIPWIEIPVPTGCATVSPVRFMTYNLGADPSLDNPKAQMKYLAENSFDILDARVYGGLFQWGRKWDKTSDATSYPVSIENNTYRRYDGDGSANHASSMAGFNLTDHYDAYGQPKTNIGDHLYSNSTNDYDWLIKNTNPDFPITYDVTLGMSPNRWGNGVAVGTATPDGGVLYNTNYYQNPVKTNYDPCPAGFRVPTQDEWERLGAYDCRPDLAGGTLTDITLTGKLTNKGLTWVPVVCNGNYPGRCFPSTGWTANTTSSGYAVYEESVWTEATTTGVYSAWAGDIPSSESFNDKESDVTTYKYPSLHSEAAGVPEPLLFLPAAGYHYHINGTMDDTGNLGTYWSSTVSNKYACYLNFSNVYVGPSYTTARASGFSIRCVVEQ
jgi:hypothetical protein